MSNVPEIGEFFAERSFTSADQKRFADLSGDANPMHLDEVFARRTLFGGPVVHGIHLLCWALDSFLAPQRRRTAITNVKVNFNRAVLVGETVRLRVVETGDRIKLQVLRGERNAASIEMRLGTGIESGCELPENFPSGCRELDFHKASVARGVVPMGFSSEAAKNLFPALSDALPRLQISALLATTRLVGMECPGLHSLYSALDLMFDAEAKGKAELCYSVVKADDRFKLLLLEVQGPGFHGTVRAFVRPEPCNQTTVENLAVSVLREEFADQRAIVVGGSRGLGEVTAKLLAIGGAEVLITYFRGKRDADTVASEINAFGGRCSVAALDIANPAPLAMTHPPTHIYYFATTPITSEKGQDFSNERFDLYCQYYVTGFVRTLGQLAQGAYVLSCFYPSTIFLDEPAQMPEYCAAKAAGEEICRQLQDSTGGRWQFYVPRLPRVKTDQTNALLAISAMQPDNIVLEHLRRMKLHLTTSGEASRRDPGSGLR